MSALRRRIAFPGGFFPVGFNQPRGRAAVNRAHPLAPDGHLFLLNGENFVDLVTGIPLGNGTGTYPQHRPGVFGPGAFFESSNAVRIEFQARESEQFTSIVGCVPISISNSNPRLVSMPRHDVYLGDSNHLGLSNHANDVGTRSLWHTGNFAFSLNAYSVIAVAHAAIKATPLFVVNGTVVSSTFNQDGSNSLPSNAGEKSYIGTNAFLAANFGDRSFDGSIYWVYIDYKARTLEEIQAISRDPFQFLVFPRSATARSGSISGTPPHARAYGPQGYMRTLIGM